MGLLNHPRISHKSLISSCQRIDPSVIHCMCSSHDGRVSFTFVKSGPTPPGQHFRGSQSRCCRMCLYLQQTDSAIDYGWHIPTGRTSTRRRGSSADALGRRIPSRLTATEGNVSRCTRLMERHQTVPGRSIISAPADAASMIDSRKETVEGREGKVRPCLKPRHVRRCGRQRRSCSSPHCCYLLSLSSSGF